MRVRSKPILRGIVVAVVLALASVMLGGSPTSAEVRRESAAAAGAPALITGQWLAAGGRVRISGNGSGSFQAIALTKIGLFETGLSECETFQTGDSVWGTIRGSDHKYTGSLTWWDTSEEPCTKLGVDTQAKFTVSEDGHGLTICSKSPESGSTHCYRATRRPSTLTAVGDSYSSGEGAGSYTGGGCHRSDHAWPKIAANLSADLRMGAFVACSGAETHHLWSTHKGEEPQVDQITPATDIVTVTIGGNDVGFSPVLKSCFLRNCVKSGKVAEARQAINRKLPGKLDAAYRAIRQKLPKGARLVVVGYPRLFPTASNLEKCDWLRSGERRELNQLAYRLDQVIAAAASRAGAKFVSVIEVLDGHEACSGKKNSWIFPIGIKGGSQRGHPTTPGQRAIARKVSSALKLRT